jgi:N6-L-threonylcarbamoyladenine synthase
LLVLGIETSCDETAASVLKGERKILSSIVASQDVHALFGGVVPELASREHMKSIIPVVDLALKTAGVDKSELDGIAVTNRPGLVGALLVGVSFAKALGYSIECPVVGVHHVEAHIFSATLENPELVAPFVALVVSGGHTQLVLVRELGCYNELGRTLDDAAGEAFDKVAKLLDLGYPGGPLVERKAELGRRDAVDFPRALQHSRTPDFSFSGLKTAVKYYVEELGHPPDAQELSDIAASFQEAVVDSLVEKSSQALRQSSVSELAVVGGVASNKRLRASLEERSEQDGFRVYYPSPELCTDNAAMIARAGYLRLVRGQSDGLELSAHARSGLSDQPEGES